MVPPDHAQGYETLKPEGIQIYKNLSLSRMCCFRGREDAFFFSGDKVLPSPVAGP